jgi:Fe-S-cluster containining protein
MFKQLLSSEDCGKCKDPCCRFHILCREYLPVFTKDEMETVLDRGFKKSFFKKISDDTYQVVPTKLEKGYLLCPFVKDKIWCSIYDISPMYCKLWPFYLMNSKDKKKVFLVYDTEEDCHGLRKKLGTKKFDDYKIYLLNFFAKQKVKKYKALIIDYYSDFKILGVIYDGTDLQRTVKKKKD